MKIDVIMPQMGESIAEGTITKWLKKAGEPVAKDDPLFEISTDKVDAEIPSPAAGVIAEIIVDEGNTVEVNTVVARIETDASVRVEPAPAPTEPKATEPDAAHPAAPTEAPAPQPIPAGAPEATEWERVRVFSSPLVRKMAAEHGVDLSLVSGTGIHGRVTKRDLLAHLESGVSSPPAPAAPAAVPTTPATAAAPAPQLGDRVEPMSTMRKVIADHMVDSKRISPHVQTFREVDVSNLVAIRERHGSAFLSRNGVKLSYTAFIAKAVCDALKAVPILNASLSGEEIHYHGAIHLGIAVSLDWGLIVPVVRHAGDMNVSGLAKSIADLSGRARSKKLSPDEVSGGTFTITNPGIYGGLFGCPVINQPQSGILGVGAIEKRPVVIDDAIAIRPMCYLGLSFDHRLIDGAVAEQFMGAARDSLAAMTEAAL
ncbi:MAG: 2-oxoglutarate dehydrogenase, E2 component, dihydrolipoamide succinyltransferase [Gemmatimonadota bacterium]|nr:2-oxoglutarate dehydrogenase, E2 component, dihydrolipoamide succinyltransferase [Gemmatimonadota bacterium]MDP6529700.1 2-oxoglutarate dehydrogenase, E2 component, dihydrolipoamide succinyltransferase [Gemmatimonadota bacterium]